METNAECSSVRGSVLGSATCPRVDARGAVSGKKAACDRAICGWLQAILTGTMYHVAGGCVLGPRQNGPTNLIW